MSIEYSGELSRKLLPNESSDVIKKLAEHTPYKSVKSSIDPFSLSLFDPSHQNDWKEDILIEIDGFNCYVAIHSLNGQDREQFLNYFIEILKDMNIEVEFEEI